MASAIHKENQYGLSNSILVSGWVLFPCVTKLKHFVLKTRQHKHFVLKNEAFLKHFQISLLERSTKCSFLFK